MSVVLLSLITVASSTNHPGHRGGSLSPRTPSSPAPRVSQSLMYRSDSLRYAVFVSNTSLPFIGNLHMSVCDNEETSVLDE